MRRQQQGIAEARGPRGGAERPRRRSFDERVCREGRERERVEHIYVPIAFLRSSGRDYLSEEDGEDDERWRPNHGKLRVLELGQASGALKVRVAPRVQRGRGASAAPYL